MSAHWRTGNRTHRARHAAGRARLEVHPHPRGPWLVGAGRRQLAVPPTVGRTLLPLCGLPVATVVQAADLAGAREADPLTAAAVVARWLAGDSRSTRGRDWRRALALPLPRAPLLPAGFVRPIARRLQPLTSWLALGLAAGAGLGAVLALRPWSGPCPVTLPVIGLFAAGALWHELGHAAALGREGYQPGRVGIGLFLCVPVLYADVSPAALLPRSGRLRVDLAGPAFQAGAAGLFALLAAGLPPEAPLAGACRASAVATVASLGYGLLPLPRTDGGWVLRDALETAAPARPAVARLRLAAAGLRYALTGLLCLALPARLVGLGAHLARRLGRPWPAEARHALVLALTALALSAWAARVAVVVTRRRRRGSARR